MTTTSCLRLVTYIGGLFFLLPSLPLHAQSTGQSRSAELAAERSALLEAATNRREAYLAFKGENAAVAIEKLSLNIRRDARAPNEDLQWAQNLHQIGCWLKNEGDAPRLARITAMALAKVDRPQGRMKAKDAAAAWSLAGEMHETFSGDPTLAIHAYEQALALEPKLRHAADRLTLLRAVVANARRKAEENELLRQRALRPKP